ncbi:helix-turn-helix domain-containing protein [Subtercola boreus]|uniref:HTH cro/C1-type domain-containing protein n=1 Tax=Subtercola boreus TaxID=120213 RepID=A0A3E0WBM0_9MICO|nr:helix-turn-helix transcriptional regulator [Subtercola boreus]RFA20529.1 hypothetical protein B7R24_08825 [Subtercola boreus]RFA20644.1 hypothetical protein B7R23_08760 [Subtercola boreus]RFA26854.1 hypothetical protein B7R25_08890 [Subtercola boreus]
MTGSEAPSPIRVRTTPVLEPLLRHILGRRLRMLRLANGNKLAETAARAGISPQYLSEIERGLKEPSSEMIAAIAGALGVTLLDLTELLSKELRGPSAVEPRHQIGQHPSIERGGTVTTMTLAFAA